MKRSDIRNFFRALHEGKGFDPIYEGKKGLYCGGCNTMNEKDVSECDTCGCRANEMQMVEFEETSEGRKIISKITEKDFPDHSGDGKITQKDILMAKGVIPKPKPKKKTKKK